MKCRICSNILNNSVFKAREMMYGMRDVFEYFSCSSCGCIQIKDYPEDIARYYPADYYSYAMPKQGDGNFLIRYFRRKRAQYCISGRGIVGLLTEKIIGRPLMFDLLRWCGVDFSSSVLDVGSGAGSLLFDLKKLGFRRLAGIDPYVNEGISYKNGIEIIRGKVSELRTAYDLIILKDSLEHMPNQHVVLEHVGRLLNPGCCALIIMPVVGYAWRAYGPNWVGLDAPRHFYIHSVRSMEILSEKSGLEIIHTVYDSNEDQFIGSEQYAKDISMFDPFSYFVDREKSIFTMDQVAYYRKRSAQLNTISDGDRICIILKKTA